MVIVVGVVVVHVGVAVIGVVLAVAAVVGAVIVVIVICLHKKKRCFYSPIRKCSTLSCWPARIV